jgi:hypothetical protein
VSGVVGGWFGLINIGLMIALCSYSVAEKWKK